MPDILARRQLIALISILLIVVSVGTVTADEGITDSAGLETIEASSVPALQTIALDDATRSTFYPAFAFRPRDTASGVTVDADTGHGCAWTSNTSLLTTEVLLPDGAVVEEVTVFANDTDPSTVTLFLSRFKLQADPGQPAVLADIFVASTSGDSGYQAVSDTTPNVEGSEVVDAINASYLLQVRAPSSTRQFCGARIVWSIPDPGLVLHPVRPCKIFDSRHRTSKAPIGAFRKASIDTIQNDYSAIGGSNTDCNLPPEAQALHISINVLNPAKPGSIRIWPKGGPFGSDPSLIFDNQGHASTAVPVVIGAGDRIIVKNQSSGKAHMVLVVHGWYGPPKS